MHPNASATPPSRLVFFLGAIALAALFLVGGEWVRSRVEAAGAETREVPVAAPALSVRVAAVERVSLARSATFHGFLAPAEERAVSALVPGDIVNQSVEISDEVSAGEELFRIDDEAWRLEYDEAVAALSRERSRADLAKARWEHLKGLPEQTSTSIEMTEAELAYRAAEAARVQAEAVADRAKLQLDRASVVSPIDGVVSRIFLRTGEFVPAGAPLVEVVEVRRLKLFAAFEDVDIVWVRPGLEAAFSVAAIPGERFTGRVVRLHPQPLPTARKFEVEIEIPNESRRLRPGFFVTGSIADSEDGDRSTASIEVVRIPREAVVELFGRHYCYVVRGGEDGALVAVRTPIETQVLPGDVRQLQVVSGVADGERVVTKGHPYLGEETRVQLGD